MENTFKNFTSNTMKPLDGIFNFWEENQAPKHPKTKV